MPTATTRPTGDNGSYSYTIVGGGTFAGSLSDDSDSSYIRISGGNPLFLAVLVARPSLPGGSRLRTLAVRARARSGANTQKIQITAGNIKSGVLAELSFGTSFVTLGTAPIVAPSVPNPIGQIEILTADYFADETFDLAELYLDAFYATQPTATVAGPTGTITDTTQPVISWSHAPGTDGGPQSAWQVLVYNDTQYSATGFQPGVSTPFWGTSGSGALSSVVPTAQLVDDDYRAYVRTAQSINGSSHWSSYASSDFTISSTPPTAPTITAAADDTLGRVRLVVTIDDEEASIARVEHSANGGSTWTPVRGGSRIIVPGSTTVLYDNEAPNGKPMMWRAQAIRPTVNGDIASAWSATASATWSSVKTWLKHVRNPNLSRTVRFHVMPEPVRDRPQGVHRVLGAEYPTVTQGRLQATASTADLLIATEADFDDVLALLAADTLLLQAPAPHRWGSRYIKPGKVTERRPLRLATAVYRVLSFPYTEVVEPPDDGVEQLAGLTWQDIIDTYPTWQDFIDAVPAWGVLF